MGSTNGVKMNWPVVAIAFAVIGVPMGVAVIQDLGSDADEEALLARIGEVDEIAAVSEAHDEADDDEADDEAGRWEQPAMDQAFFDEVLTGVDHSALPDLSRWPRARAGWLTPERAGVEVMFPDDGSAARILASRWGDPLIVAGVDGLERRIWIRKGRRVILEQFHHDARATYTSALPASDYIGPGGRFAFEREPVLGATPDMLERSLTDFVLDADESGRFRCPGIDVSEGDAQGAIEFAAGKAVKLAVVIDHRLDVDAGPRVFAALRERLGEVRRQSGDEHGNTWVFDRGYTVTQVAGQPWIRVERVAR